MKHAEKRASLLRDMRVFELDKQRLKIWLSGQNLQSQAQAQAQKGKGEKIIKMTQEQWLKKLQVVARAPEEKNASNLVAGAFVERNLQQEVKSHWSEFQQLFRQIEKSSVKPLNQMTEQDLKNFGDVSRKFISSAQNQSDDQLREATKVMHGYLTGNNSRNDLRKVVYGLHNRAEDYHRQDSWNFAWKHLTPWKSPPPYMLP
jgi:hypothetical protein